MTSRICRSSRPIKHTNKVAAEPKVRKAPAEPAPQERKVPVDPALQERKATEPTQPKKKSEPASRTSSAAPASSQQRNCIARGCNNLSWTSSKYCGSTCAEKVAAARVEVNTLPFRGSAFLPVQSFG